MTPYLSSFPANFESIVFDHRRKMAFVGDSSMPGYSHLHKKTVFARRAFVGITNKVLRIILVCLVIVSCENSGTKTHAISAAQPAKAVASKAFKIYSADAFFENKTIFGSSINHNGSAVLVSRDERGIFNLYRYAIDGANITQLTHSNGDAQTQLDIHQTTTGEKLQLPNLPADDVHSVNFSDDEKQVVFYVNSDISPSNLYSYKIGDESTRRLSNSFNPNIDESHLVAREVVRYKIFDGLDISNLLFKPQQASASNKVPAIIFIHGGYDVYR